jgi:hypothetical protein
MLNWSAFEQAIATGYEYAVRRLEKLPPDSLLRASLLKEGAQDEVQYAGQGQSL